MGMRLIKPIIYAGWLVSIILLSSCSSHIPPEIKENLEGTPSLAQVRQQADDYLSQKVRWGGVILNAENKHNASWLTILAYPLNDLGKPQASDQSPGRFIAIVDKFLEPMVYKQDRKITVVGNLLRTETFKIGEFPYAYPIIQVEHHYLWLPDPEPSDMDYHPYWWHDPFYDPYYPYYPRHHYY